MIIIWILAIIVLDQVTKYLAVKILKGKGKVDRYGFSWCYVENAGAAMGFLKKWPLLLKSLSLVLIIGLGFVLMESYESDLILRTYVLATILAGGVSNVMDRFTRGYVVDFYSPKIKKLPYFNIADFFVIIGCVLLVFVELNI